jgi:methylenetetrahydrofolate dehydrogenase (NADP+)/methenyltetrahydrofolate cyclohydrolase
MAGDREDSELYVKIKQEEAKKTGIDTHLYRLESQEGQAELLQIIHHLNRDDEVDAVLIQLPLPERFNSDEAIKMIDPDKDADCFHPKNIKKINSFDSEFLPPVFGAVKEILKEMNFDFKDKKACVIGNSKIFGKNLCDFISLRDILCDFVDSQDPDLPNKTKKADLLISAVGKPGVITEQHIKEGAAVIDVGISKENGRVRGDVDLKSAKNKASYLTPVPGGVGPITVAMLFRNTLILS